MLQQESNITEQQTTASQKVKKPQHTSENVYVCKSRKIQTPDDPTDTGEVCNQLCQYGSQNNRGLKRNTKYSTVFFKSKTR